jgi:dTDP-4-amino-4,6-dideoxygalactose transaminase
MFARKQIDIGYRDLTAALGYCLWPSLSRRRIEADLESLWAEDGDAVTALSVRSAFDCWLATQNLPRGSEVIVSGINIPDMARILEHHGLQMVPVDVDLATMEILADEVEDAITPRTRMVLVAHLFGSRMDMDPVFEITRQHPEILVVEDCAQAFDGCEGYRGDARSDLSLFSFGAIKTASALGGALARVRDAAVRERMRTMMAEYPAQGRAYFFKRALKFAALKTLGLNWIYTAFTQACGMFGVDYDLLVVNAVRGFRGDLIPLLRRQPALPQLALLRRRLRQYPRAHLEARRQAGQRVNHQLPTPLRCAGHANPHNTWWLFPVYTENKSELVTDLHAQGFDATASSSQLCPMEGEDGPAVDCEDFMDGTVYVPVYAGIPNEALDRLAATLRHHAHATQSIEVLPVEEPKLEPAILAE